MASSGGIDMRIEGANQLAEVGKALKAAARKDLNVELRKSILRATKEIKTDVKEAWAQELPQKGGLAEAVSKSRITTRTSFGAKAAGVRLVAKGLSVQNLRNMDRGYIKHPVFGNRNVSPWPRTKVTPEIWENTILKKVDGIRDEILRAIDETTEKIARA